MNRNSGVQGLRAIAALLVLIQHGVYWSATARGLDYAPYLPVDYGRIGVVLFFVISGYVMTLCLKQGRMFLVWRAVRIYPAFWAAVLLSAILLPIIGRPWYVDLPSLLLLPTTDFNNTYAVPYWTLIFEMVFYVVMYLFILTRLSRRGMIAALVVWATLIVVVGQAETVPLGNIYSGGFAGVVLSYLLSPVCLAFIAGALYGLVAQPVFRRASWWPVLLMGSAFLLAAQFTVQLSGLLYMMLLMVACTFALDLATRLPKSRFMESAGDDTYGLYLLHVICILVALQLVMNVAPGAAIGILVASAVAAGLIGGMTFGALEYRAHSYLLKPAIRRVQKRWG